jgi:hypothetical protein
MYLHRLDQLKRQQETQADAQNSNFKKKSRKIPKNKMLKIQLIFFFLLLWCRARRAQAAAQRAAQAATRDQQNLPHPDKPALVAVRPRG